jgi:hypothetical protein
MGTPHDDLLPRLLRFSWIGIVMILLLLLPFAAPLWSLIGAERLLTYPWQLLLLACPLFAVAAGSVPALNPQLQRFPLWLALVGLVMLSSYPYLHADYTQVEPPDMPVATFGEYPDLVVLAAQVHEDAEASKATLDVTWQVLQPIPFDYSVFFQALTQETDTGDNTGKSVGNDTWRVVAQLDTQPRHGLEPATTWQVGKIMTDTYQLALPDPLPAGELRYIYGYYDWRDGKRLPVDGGIDDKLILHGE